MVGSDAYPDISINATPYISSVEAQNIAKSNFTALSRADSITIRKEPVLIVLPIENDTGYDYFLTYHTELEYLDSNYIYSETYFIDAKTGDIVMHFSNILDGWINGTVNINYWPEHYNDSQSSDAYKSAKIKLTSIWGTTQYQYTNSNGYYLFSNLAVNPYWVSANIEGNYIALYNNNDSHTYGYIYPDGTHNWTWSVSDGSNVYYHGNLIHDFFKNSPFNYSVMDYRMKAYVNEGTNRNGWSDGINIGFGSQNGQYWARSSDVIYHEYTHSTIYHLYDNNWIGDPNQYYSEGAAMDEGISDYFACTINNDSIQGESVGVNRDLDNNTYSWNPNAGAHWNGQVIGGACWDLRQDLGKSYVDQLVFEALQMTPHAYNFEDFALNVVIADDNDGNIYNGSPNYTSIKQAFETNHGITLFELIDPLSVSINGLLYLGFKQSETYYANVNGGSGSISYQWYRKDDNWSSWFSHGTSQSQLETMIRTNFTLKVVVNRGSETDSATKYVVYSDEPLLKSMILPETYSLSQNHPNPFNPITTIKYELPEPSYVSLVVYDLMGHEVIKWENDYEDAGFRHINWDGINANGMPVPAGIYLYRLTAKSIESDQVFTQSRKMVLLK